jgi:hypothetical protein
MWKGLCVVGLWGLMIAAPHALSQPADDPGDSFVLAAPPQPAPPRVPSGSFATSTSSSASKSAIACRRDR